jgi:hypothetical protein
MEDNDTADDNGYETDQDNVHDHDQDQAQDIIITDEEYLLLKTFILETTKPNAYKLSKIYNPNVESIRQLFIQIVQHNLIKYYQLHPDFTKKPYNDGSITIHAYLHLLEIDNRMYELLSPRITKEDYDAIDALYPGVKSVDYGCKFIESIKFYHTFIIIILSLNKRILKIERDNKITFGNPILTVFEGGNTIILDWTHPSNILDPTQFSKLMFTKSGSITDMYWTDLQGNEYRDEILPSHIALRPNRFNNCWYLNYNTHIKLPDDTFDVVKFSIHCCDS